MFLFLLKSIFSQRILDFPVVSDPSLKPRPCFSGNPLFTWKLVFSSEAPASTSNLQTACCFSEAALCKAVSPLQTHKRDAVCYQQSHTDRKSEKPQEVSKTPPPRSTWVLRFSSKPIKQVETRRGNSQTSDWWVTVLLSHQPAENIYRRLDLDFSFWLDGMKSFTFSVGCYVHIGQGWFERSKYTR